ncbi:MAG: hypothetical protein ACYDBY_01605 [Thermoanaerobaculia bacterium]
MLKTITRLLAISSLALVAPLHAQTLRGQADVLQPAAAGQVAIDKSKPHWTSHVLDALAARANVVVIRSGFNIARLPEIDDREGTLLVSEGTAGIREFVKLAGYETEERAPGVLLVGEKDNEIWDRPLVIFAEELAGMGSGARTSVPREKLEWKLLQTAYTGMRALDPSLNTTCISTYYWPTAEGNGREFYVLQQNSADIDARYPTGRLLRKVSVTNPSGDLEIRDEWGETKGWTAASRRIKGPVADLELDFDRDGVIDIVVYSGEPGETCGFAPLHVLSGRTGEEIGTLEGYEFLVTQDAAGRPKVRTLGRDGYRDYAINEEGRVELVRREELQTRVPTMALLGQGAASQAAAGRDAPEEKVIDNFVLPLAPSSLNLAVFSKVRKLKELGEKMTAPRGRLDVGSEARVYADHRPKQQGVKRSQK